MKNYDRLTLNEVAISYRNMILNEAAGGRDYEWWELLKKANSNPIENFDRYNPQRYPRDFAKPVRVPKGKPWRQNAPEQWRRDRDELSRFQRGYKPRPQPTIPGIDQQIQDAMRQQQTARPTRKPTAPRTPAPKPGARPIRGVRPAVGAAGGILTLLSLYSIYQDLFGDDGTEVDVIPDDGQVIKPVNVDQPGLDLQPLYVPPHQRDPNNYPGQHPVRPPKAPAGGSQGSGGGIGGGGGMGM